MRKAALVWTTALLLLAACTTAPPEPTPADRAIGHWVGRPIAEAVAAWGAPSEERPAEGGGRLYIWLASHYDRRYYPANLYEPLPYGAYGKTPEELACRGVLETDAADIVRKAEWVGYECHFLP
jgi:hypothetical protein